MVAIKDLLGETMIRTDGRKVDELRPVRITRHFTDVPEGSVLVECGNTRVMCTPRSLQACHVGARTPAWAGSPRNMRCCREPLQTAPIVNPCAARSADARMRSAD